jgi:hypothetical protein
LLGYCSILLPRERISDTDFKAPERCGEARQRQYEERTSERKPSCFSSKSQAGSSKGSRGRASLEGVIDGSTPNYIGSIAFHRRPGELGVPASTNLTVWKREILLLNSTYAIRDLGHRAAVPIFIRDLLVVLSLSGFRFREGPAITLYSRTERFRNASGVRGHASSLSCRRPFTLIISTECTN